MKEALLNRFYFFVGLIFLGLARVKFALKGYNQSSFSTLKMQNIVDYDFRVVDKWIKQLQLYTDGQDSDLIKGKSVLELGPGGDLGIGLYLLSKSVKEYTAIDTYNLIENTPSQFYELLFSKLADRSKSDIEFLKSELNKTLTGGSDKLNYIVSKDFDIIKAVAPKKINLIFSQAAFEHFDDINETIKGMSTVADQGAYFVAVVDLQTHSRWIRKKDPNNIYRYPNWLYGLFSFRGSPNRIRPYQYIDALQKNGWKNIKVYSDQSLSEELFNSTTKYLNKQFVHDRNEMNYLSIWLCATKA
ncbi:MAG TPA: hypothetical protein DGG95_00770 [Cytophagales bacterium]|jgi:hypothetical protein|nr:hypothetical protein [Cytophagales bacterium]